MSNANTLFELVESLRLISRNLHVQTEEIAHFLMSSPDSGLSSSYYSTYGSEEHEIGPIPPLSPLIDRVKNRNEKFQPLLNSSPVRREDCKSHGSIPAGLSPIRSSQNPQNVLKPNFEESICSNSSANNEMNVAFRESLQSEDPCISRSTNGTQSSPFKYDYASLGNKPRNQLPLRLPQHDYVNVGGKQRSQHPLPSYCYDNSQSETLPSSTFGNDGSTLSSNYRDTNSSTSGNCGSVANKRLINNRCCDASTGHDYSSEFSQMSDTSNRQANSRCPSTLSDRSEVYKALTEWWGSFILAMLQEDNEKIPTEPAFLKSLEDIILQWKHTGIKESRVKISNRYC